MNLRLNAVLLALLTALIAVLGDWSGSSQLGSLWRFPAGLLLLGLAYESFVAHRAQVTLTMDAGSRWYLGRTNHLRMYLEQRLHRHLLVEFAPFAPPPFNLDFSIRTVGIPAATRALVEVPVTPRQLGSFQWPVQRIRVAGPLGLASWSQRLETQYSVQVLPDLSRNAPDAQGLGMHGDRVALRRGAGAELQQLRRYQPGDPPRIIDWKASARARRLISRDYAEDQHLEVVVVVDAGRSSGLRAGDLDRFGHYVNVAASLAQYVVSRGDLVGLVLYADQPLLALAPARGTAAVTRLRKALAGAQVTGTESSPLGAAMRVRSLVRQRSLVVLLTDLDDAAVASQLQNAVRLLLPKHLPFIAGLSSAAADSLANSTANDWLDPFRSLAAQEYCTGLERKVQALRALGAPALVARPDQLERAVLEAYGKFRQQRRV
ncbi:MAG: DUF58 domain-containing protein [Steroidobacteraceae bacterium]